MSLLKVEGPKSTGAAGVRRAKPTGGSSSGQFASELERATSSEEEDAAPAPVERKTVVGIGGILAAQDVSDQNSNPGDRRRRAQRGVELLERLEEIRRGLLLGTIPKERLGELARMVRDKRERGADPVLSRLLDEIELRASVELAKLGLPVF